MLPCLDSSAVVFTLMLPWPNSSVPVFTLMLPCLVYSVLVVTCINSATSLEYDTLLKEVTNHSVLVRSNDM